MLLQRPFMMASEIEQAHSLGENGGGEEASLLEQVVIERRNLLNIVKLTVKVLIESAMRRGQPMDDSDSNLQQLFTAIEHSLRHRLKGELSHILESSKANKHQHTTLPLYNLGMTTYWSHTYLIVISLWVQTAQYW